MCELNEGRKMGPTIKLLVLGEEGGPHIVAAAHHQILKGVLTEQTQLLLHLCRAAGVTLRRTHPQVHT